MLLTFKERSVLAVHYLSDLMLVKKSAKLLTHDKGLLPEEVELGLNLVTDHFRSSSKPVE